MLVLTIQFRCLFNSLSLARLVNNVSEDCKLRVLFVMLQCVGGLCAECVGLYGARTVGWQEQKIYLCWDGELTFFLIPCMLLSWVSFVGSKCCCLCQEEILKLLFWAKSSDVMFQDTIRQSISFPFCSSCLPLHSFYQMSWFIFHILLVATD